MRFRHLGLALLSAWPLGCGGKPDPAPAKPAEVGTPGPPAVALPLVGESDAQRAYKQRVKELGEAAEAGRISLIQALLKSGADVNDKDDRGRTALHKAAAKGHKGACATLLAFGADPGEKDADGVTPLMEAAAAGHASVIKLMVSPDEIVNAAGEFLKDAAKATIGNKEKFYDRVFGIARSARTARDKFGQTALHKAAAGGHDACFAELYTYDAFTGAFKAEENWTVTDALGNTPLALAASAGHRSVFQYGAANPVRVARALGIRNAAGKDVFDLAKEAGHTALLVQLEPLRVVAAAGRNEVAAVEAAYLNDPKTFPARTFVLIACQEKHLALLTKVLGYYATKSSAEKLELLGPGRTVEILRLAMFGSNWAEGCRALVDPKWWNDGPALAGYIDGTQILRSGPDRDTYSSHKVISDAYDAVKKK